MIQEAGRVAAHLTVFQRTPNLAQAMQQKKLDAATQEAWKPKYSQWFAERDASDGGQYFVRQADWLQERFPDAELRDVEGLVNLVTRSEIEAHDWSLAPGRYVGVAREEVDEDFDFEEALRSIHVDLRDLNDEAADLAARIARNFEELGA